MLITGHSTLTGFRTKKSKLPYLVFLLLVFFFGGGGVASFGSSIRLISKPESRNIVKLWSAWITSKGTGYCVASLTASMVTKKTARSPQIGHLRAFQNFRELDIQNFTSYLSFLMASAMTGATETWLMAEGTVSVPTTSRAPAS